MHEAGLARGVARALRERGLRVEQVRLAVRGGHHEVAEFERELRAYLTEAVPEQAAAVGWLEIRRIAFGHLCPCCGSEFEAVATAAACPSCGAESLPAITNEQIEIELLEAVR